jgi:predicted nucleic acid-binding protein
MASAVFVDTSAFVGKFLEEDEHHRRATSVMRSLLREGRHFISTDYIFDEVVTRMRGLGGHSNAVKAGDGILQSEVIELIDVDPHLRKEAWKLFRKYKDQKLSFTDCSSFAVMEKFGISEAFTFNDDFRKVGYLTIPGRD